MIRSKQDLEFYLAADKFAIDRPYKHPRKYDDVWKFQILLRKVEFYKNTEQGLINRLLYKFYKNKKYKLGLKLGLEISPNIFGAGLRINHFGNIVINGKVKVGMWCDIHQGVNIGTNISSNKEVLVPKIGNNVWIGPGAKIFGNIGIGSNTVIGANAVVNKSFTNSQTIAGVPAKVIKKSGTEILHVAANSEKMNEFFQMNPKYIKYKLKLKI